MRTAIELGNKEEAKSLIAKLAEKSLKLSLHVLDKKIPDNNIWIHIKIEGRDGKPTTIVLAVDPFEITIKMLKLKVKRKISFQWISSINCFMKFLLYYSESWFISCMSTGER